MSSKERILNLLESNKDSYLSGEAMAKELSLSRNAIWKAINELRKAGYNIEAISNKGYRLATSNDIISVPGILSYMDDSDSEKVADKIHIYDSLDSTNKHAKELAISGAAHGTLVISKSQTLGKGRRDHSFFSPDGGIYMSIILSPDHLPTLDKDAITTHTGVAVCQAIEELCSISPKIKPINDLFVDGKKVCGILTESGIEFETGLVQWIVIGIGINFDSDISKFPVDLQPVVGSLFSRGNACVTKNELISNIYKRITHWDDVDTTPT